MKTKEQIESQLGDNQIVVKKLNSDIETGEPAIYTIQELFSGQEVSWWGVDALDEAQQDAIIESI